MNCIVCSKPIQSVRKDAKFCSGACKVKAHRLGVTVTDNNESQTPVLSDTIGTTVTDSSNQTVTDKLTPTDKDLADHLPAYLPKYWYKYSDRVFKRKCATCSKTYSTKLELNRYCSNVCKMSQLTTAPQT